MLPKINNVCGMRTDKNADLKKDWHGYSPWVLGVELIYPAGVPVCLCLSASLFFLFFFLFFFFFFFSFSLFLSFFPSFILSSFSSVFCRQVFKCTLINSVFTEKKTLKSYKFISACTSSARFLELLSQNPSFIM